MKQTVVKDKVEKVRGTVTGTVPVLSSWSVDQQTVLDQDLGVIDD